MGVVAEMLKHGLKVYLYNIPHNVDAAPESDAAFQFVNKVLQMRPHMKMLAVDHGGLTSNMPIFMKKLNLSPDDIFVLGFDLSKTTVKGIENGYLDLVIDQQPFLQGFLPALQVCLSKKYGFTGLFIDTGSSLIDKGNVKFVKKWALREIC